MTDEPISYDWNDRRTRRQPAPAPILQPVNIGTGHDAYGQAALTRELDELTATTEGGRNHQLNKAAFSLAQLVASNHLNGPDTESALRSAALQIGLTPSEVEATLRSAFRAGALQPRDVPELAPQVTEVPVLQLAPASPPPGDEADPGEDGPAARTSWWPTRLTHRAALADETPTPTHLVRDDGQALLYSSKVNGIIGESESGKSWVALLAVTQAVNAGQRVLILDFEDSPKSIERRLISLGLTDYDDLIFYANPDESLTALASVDLGEALAGGTFALIVADGVNAAMTLLGYDLNSNTDATLFATKLLRPLAATGACVLTIDHVPKNSEQRGKGGIGAQAKRAMLDGTSLLAEIVAPFGKGQSGELRLTVDKDRNGYVRGASSGGRYAGKVHLKSIGDQVRMHIDAPDTRPADERPTWRPTGLMEKVSRLLERAEQPMSGNEIYEAVRGRKQLVLQAVAELVAGGHITAEKRSGRGGGDAYESVRPFRETDTSGNGSTGSQPVPGTGYETGSGPVPPKGTGTSSTAPTEPQQPQVVPEPLPTIDMPDGFTNCNHCGEATADAIIDEHRGYCTSCAQDMGR